MLFAVRHNAQATTRESLRPKRAQSLADTITVADLCQAIASGLIPAVVDKDNYYTVQKKAVREYAERAHRAKRQLSFFPSNN